MGSYRRTTSPPRVVLAYDATREHTELELRLAINNVRMRGDIISGGDTLLVLGNHTKACTDSFVGTNARALEEEVLKKLDMYESMLLPIACKVAVIQDTLSVDVVKQFLTNSSSDSEFKPVYSVERSLHSALNAQYLCGGYFASISSLDISAVHGVVAFMCSPAVHDVVTFMQTEGS